jgi:hypothetical protein
VRAHGESAPANSVPAAAVIQRVQALSGFTGRKVFRRRLSKLSFKYWGLTSDREIILEGLKSIRATRTIGVGVKSVDINRNSEGEGR